MTDKWIVRSSEIREKRKLLGPIPGGRFWALEHFNDLPYSGKEFQRMRLSRTLGAGDQVWYQELNYSGEPVTDWIKINDPSDIPDVEVKKSWVPAWDGWGRELSYTYDPLIQLYIVGHHGGQQYGRSGKTVGKQSEEDNDWDNPGKGLPVLIYASIALLLLKIMS